MPPADRTPEFAEPNDPNSRVFGPREQLAVWLLLGSAFVVILNETIMGVALPELMHTLDISASEGQWLTTAFLLTMSVVIPITGMLIQRVGTRALFIVAMSLFSIGTLIAAVAPGLPVLLVGRVVQACGTAIMMPLLMTTVVTLVPPSQRGRLMGRISIVMSVAPALGPTVSGLILEVLSWRWLFLLVLPIALFALVLGGIRMPNVGVRKRTSIDLLSVLLSVLGFGGLVYGLSEVGSAANGAAVVSPFVPAGRWGRGARVLRVATARAAARAIARCSTCVPSRVARTRSRSILIACASMALFGSLILVPIYAQNVLGVTAAADRSAAVAWRPAHGPARPGRRAVHRRPRRPADAHSRNDRDRARAALDGAVHRNDERLAGPRNASRAEYRTRWRVHAAVLGVARIPPACRSPRTVAR